MKGILADLQRDSYRDRILIVLDSVHTANLPEQLELMGVLKQNIVIWPRNGIEYYYPPTLIDRIYGAGPEIRITGDLVVRNDVSYSKGELARKVTDMIEAETPMHEEFGSRLLSRLYSTQR